jgi:hypothetical protein
MKILTTLKISKGFHNSENKLVGVILTLTCTDPEEASNTKDFTFSWIPPSDINATTMVDVLTWDTLHDNAILAGDYPLFVDICTRECELLWAGDTVNNLDIPYEEE